MTPEWHFGEPKKKKTKGKKKKRNSDGLQNLVYDSIRRSPPTLKESTATQFVSSVFDVRACGCAVSRSVAR